MMLMTMKKEEDDYYYVVDDDHNTDEFLLHECAGCSLKQAYLFMYRKQTTNQHILY